ncbi:nitrophenyl compound nitroreductase subunit ArsF family protein [Candidatus Aenigmatarchaeota archaeon]
MKRIIIIFLLMTILISLGCVNQEESNTNINSADNTLIIRKDIPYSKNVEKIEVFHFHGNNQCQGCINVGKCAESAVNEYFQDEQKSGLVMFDHINSDLPENVDIVQQYGTIGSSLWIGVYLKDGSFSKEHNINVWYKTSDMKKCKEYIKGVIEKKLKG